MYHQVGFLLLLLLSNEPVQEMVSVAVMCLPASLSPESSFCSQMSFEMKEHPLFLHLAWTFHNLKLFSSVHSFPLF